MYKILDYTFMSSKSLELDVIKIFQSYFEQNGHKMVSSSSLLPEGDTSVLLTTAGMQQFKPYYLGDSSPFGNRVASVQKCVRVDDIEEVGDNTHLTFFEMLGNFSFQYPKGENSYFKKEAIRFGYELIAERLGLTIDYVTVFKGDATTPADEESLQIWQELMKEKNIAIPIQKEGREDNFWGPTGSHGPCGPTTEIYVNGVEIWNIVFNQYLKDIEGKYTPMEMQGVDTGGGYERILATVEQKPSVFETSLLSSTMNLIQEKYPSLDNTQKRIVTDHARACIFLIGDGVLPSNKEQGYVLRRLLRRMMIIGGVSDNWMSNFEMILSKFLEFYQERYPNLAIQKAHILEVVEKEYIQLKKALEQGMKFAQKILKTKSDSNLTGEEAFRLHTSYGLAPEIMLLQGITFDPQEFERAKSLHQDVSRAGAQKKFGGHGLILDNGELKASTPEEVMQVTKLHTATHLLNQALKDVLGNEVSQKGSDITPERTRFDFSFERKLTNEELQKVEQIVNDKIQEGIDVDIREMDLEQAKKTGALFMKGRNYPQKVKVYAFGDYSKELCGGPHVNNTREIGRFIIKKEEAVARGIRRIRGVIE
jgi:alanyl-tRNA synthetase